jgi:hypothetical protein
MDTENKAKVPPYVAYRTLRNFLEKFKQVLPGRIDRDSMGTMSGANQSQLTSALRALGLISENGLPSEDMKLLVKAEGAERQRILKEVLTAAYPFVFNGEFDFSAATVSHLRDEFEENTGASGETVTRCIAFLKDAAEDAGIRVSPFLTQRKPRGPGAARVKKSTNGQAPKPEESGDQPKPPKTTEDDPAKYSMTIQLPQAGGALVLSGNFDPFALRGEERVIFYKLVDMMADFEASRQK